MAEKSKSKNVHVPSSTEGDALPQWHRQKPGVACEECRRRKLRCDRGRPQCGNCQSAGVTCHVTTRSPRGPKQGYLKSLQARIDALEGSVRQQAVHANVPQNTCILTVPAAEGNQVLNDEYIISPNTPFFDTTMDLSHITGQPFLNDLLHTTPTSATIPDIDFSWNVCPGSTTPLISPDTHFDTYSAAEETAPVKRRASVISDIDTERFLEQPQVSSLVQADLDQFYWDRIHVFIPIIHQRRYRTWSRHPEKSEAQKCLQSTMWALAAAASTGHHQSIRDSLYHSGCRAVEQLASANAGLTRRIEYIQAWLLLATYEFMFQDFRRGWISAGRAFRLIQLAGYESTDASNKGEPHYQPAWAEIEERRRTLWLAYCLDRLLGLRSDTPVTFGDQILVRLPAPEVNFSNDQPVQTDFLLKSPSSTDLVAECDSRSSTLAIFVGVARMCGQVTAHRHQAVAAIAEQKSMESLQSRHDALRADLTKNMNDFFANPYLSNNDDAIFISILWHTISLHLSLTAGFTKVSDDTLGTTERPISGSEPLSPQSVSSVQEVMKLLDQMSQLDYLKVKDYSVNQLNLDRLPLTLALPKIHPLIFLPLSLCAEIAETDPGQACTFKNELRNISERLNGAARTHFEVGFSA